MIIKFVDSSSKAAAAYRMLAAVAILSGLAGCGSILSGAGPSINAIENGSVDGDASQYTLVDLSAKTIGPYMRPTEPDLSSAVSTTEIPEIRLVPGDVLRVLITDDSGAEKTVFAPLAAGGTVFDNVRVDSHGFISLPYVGARKVSGATPAAVEKVIKSAISGQQASRPQVRVELVGDLSGSVLVAGAVKTPGRFSALQGPLTLLDAINRAGGPVMEPHLTRVVMRTGSTVRTFNYQDLLAGRNEIIPPHSEVVVERARKRFVAMGAVTEPGLHDLPSNNPSLLEVLGTVGGLRENQADASGVFVFRLNEVSGESSGMPKAEVFRLNLKDPAAIFLARQFLVQPEDAVYVTNAAVYEWQKIIAPIVQVMVVGRTIDAFNR